MYNKTSTKRALEIRRCPQSIQPYIMIQVTYLSYIAIRNSIISNPYSDADFFYNQANIPTDDHVLITTVLGSDAIP